MTQLLWHESVVDKSTNTGTLVRPSGTDAVGAASHLTQLKPRRWWLISVELEHPSASLHTRQGQVLLDGKLDWLLNTNALYRKRQSRLFFPLRRLDKLVEKANSLLGRRLDSLFYKCSLNDHNSHSNGFIKKRTQALHEYLVYHGSTRHS